MKHLLLIYLFVCFCLFNSYGQLSGNYSIGGSSPDFSSVSAAITALNTSGVSGPVVFKLRPGNYNEQLLLTNVTGISSLNSLTFIADSLGASIPRIYFKGITSSNFVLRINGLSHTNFKNIEFESIDSTYGRVVLLEGTCQNVHFDSCSFIGVSNYSNSSDCHLIDNLIGSSNMITNSSIKGCKFSGGSTSVYWEGSSNTLATQEDGNVFSDNELLDFGNNGLYLRFQKNVIAKNNIINTFSNYGFVYGLNLQHSSLNNRIYDNRIRLKGNSNNRNYGIELYSCGGSFASQGIVYNNFISISNSNSNSFGVGISSYSCGYLKVYHNSIHISADIRYAFGMDFFRSAGGSNTNYVYILNNNIEVLGDKGIAMDISNYYYSSITLVVNHNNYHIPNSIFIGKWQGTNIGNLASWRSTTTLDANSITQDPFYYSDSNLHIRSVALNGKAVAVSGVGLDIDGNVRVNPADIGADEASFPSNDAGVIGIETGGIICPGQNQIFANLMNNGTSTLNSATINWEVSTNSASYVNQSGINFSGSILSGVDTIISLGSYSFLNGNTYSIKCFSLNPNNTNDTVFWNDTIIHEIDFALEGRYTIGGVSPDFSTFNEAKNALEKRGICSSVVFDVRPGTYSEQLNFQKAINGTNANNTITFRTDTASTNGWAKLIHNSDFTIQLGGGINNVLFDSLEMEMTTSGNVVELNGVNDHISFNGNKITGYNTYSTSVGIAAVYDWSGNNTTNFEFTNNYVKYGTHGIYLSGSGINNTQDSFLITNNVFDECGVYGINLHYIRHGLVQENEVIIDGLSSNCSGLIADYLYSTDIIGNRIFAKAVYNSIGLDIDHFFGTISKRAIIANNMVCTPKGSSANILKYCYYTDAVYNSFYGKQASGGTGLVRISLGTGFSFQNNSVFNDANGAALNAGGTSTRNNNNLFSYWTNGHIWGQTQGPNGLNVNPGYASTATGDLHIVSNLLNGKGKPLSFMNYDYDLELRDTTVPDIGADEFSKIRLAKDVQLHSIRMPGGPCFSSKDTIFYTLKNEGSQSLNFTTDNFNVVLTTSGASQQNVSKTINTGVLSPLGTSAGYVLINLEDTGNHQIELKLVSNWDLDKTNDTLWNNQQIRKQAAPSYTPGEVCFGDLLTVFGQSIRDTIYWYDDAGLTNNVFIGDTFSIGKIATDTTLYMVEFDTNGCNSVVKEAKIRVNSLPVISINNPGRTCSGNTTSRNLFASPSGGAFTGIGVSGNSFSPIGLQPGNYAIYYEFTDAKQCTNLDSAFFIIDSIPKVTFDTLLPICLNGPSIPLTQGKPNGGAYSGPGVNASSFKATSIGTKRLNYKYTNSLGCEGSAFTSIRVDSVPNVSFDTISPICLNGPSITLKQGNPIGGIYSGKDVTGVVFNASSAASYRLIYSYKNTLGCEDSAFSTIRVDSIPVVKLSDFPVLCSEDSLLMLSQGSPVGGVYSGKWVSNSIFEANANNIGTNQIQYWFKDGNNCSDSVVKSIQVVSNPYFTLGDDIDICNKEKALLLNPLTNMKYAWSTGDSSISIEVGKGGIYTSTITDTSTIASCAYSDTIVVNYEAICAALKENVISELINLYPNPTTGIVNLELQNVSSAVVVIKLYTAEGKLVSELIKMTTESSQNKVQLDLSEFSDGLYLLMIDTGSGMSWNRVQVVK